MAIVFLIIAVFTAMRIGAQSPRAPVVNVAYAASLVTLMERSVKPAFESTGHVFEGEAKGSVALANFIREGLRRPDVFISADRAVLQSLEANPQRPVRWDLSFASARLLVGYSMKSPFAGSLRRAAEHRRSLVSLLQQTGLRIGRTDPSTDPKGYRTLISLKLAERYYHEPNLTNKLIRNSVVLPEETLAVRLESGDLDAAFLYSTESASRQLPGIELPAAINLGSTALAHAYAKASVHVGNKTIRGAPILYALTIPEAATNKRGALAFIQFLFSKRGRRLLERSGLQFVRVLPGGDRRAIPQILLQHL